MTELEGLSVPLWAAPALWDCVCGHGLPAHKWVGAGLYCSVCRAPCPKRRDRI